MTEITFDEFAEAEVAAEAEIDRHGVDRSADAEGKRIDDAYEKYRDYDATEEAKKAIWLRGECKWCQLPNGKHHPNCSLVQARRIGGSGSKLQENLANAMEAEVLKSIEEGIEGTKNFNTEPMIWKIDSGTEVFVSDNKGVLRGHRMKKDAVYSDLQIMGDSEWDKQGRGLSEVPMKFVYPELCGQKLSTNLKTLVDGGWVVIETGLKRWPFIIARQKHAIVVYASLEGYVGRSGGTCRKLGY